MRLLFLVSLLSVMANWATPNHSQVVKAPVPSAHNELYRQLGQAALAYKMDWNKVKQRTKIRLNKGPK